MTPASLGVSIVVPAFNEEARLGATLDELSGYLGQQPWDWEIRVVDDGSADATRQIAESFAHRDPRFRVLSDSRPAEGGAVESERIVIPKGSYRLAVQSVNPPAAAPVAVPVEVPAPRKRAWLPGALAASVVLNVLIGLAAYLYFRPAPDELAVVRSNPVWSKILADNKPILVVLGEEQAQRRNARASGGQRTRRASDRIGCVGAALTHRCEASKTRL